MQDKTYDENLYKLEKTTRNAQVFANVCGSLAEVVFKYGAIVYGVGIAVDGDISPDVRNFGLALCGTIYFIGSLTEKIFANMSSQANLAAASTLEKMAEKDE